ncbi:chorismate mutase [Marinomonas posidonica]|uniref:chorismate mutase n=1 Tax=Marinomonas posidonica (strain CECT 7376 / NCIMB 14433 / IVIA-Po-181) TaxID=491952 RepID=F6CTU1_MARPP|nr:chorismate mutase [Marinomonas posidonica]AEF56310.1 Chorismate mutase, type II [Marinomonas posidonica IVIA-Po-181]
MEDLSDYRKSIDNIDNAIIAMFAERFKVTNKVGIFKAKNGLPAKDIEREDSQFTRIAELAETYGLDPEFAKDFLKTVIDRVVSNHVTIANSYSFERHDNTL